MEKTETEVKPLSTLERVSRIEEALGSAKTALKSVSETSMYATEKVLSVETSLTSVAKLLTALLKELTEKKLVDNDSIYERMRLADEEFDMAKLDNMKKANLIESVDSVDEMSLVVIKSTLVNVKTGDIKVLSNFLTLDLAIIPQEDNTKKSLLGKKIGETLELGEIGDGSKILYTIKEIYEIKPQQIDGEDIRNMNQG